MISRNDPCWCNSGKKWKKCHWPQESDGPNFEENSIRYKKQYNISLKTPKQIEGIKEACKLAATILDKVCKAAKEGVTTNELNELALQLHKDAEAIPAPLGYGDPPFPKAICTSLNDVICHGIPNDIPLEEGDFLNIDVTAVLNGYYGDCSKMVAIGEIGEEKQRVMKTAKECLDQSIEILKPGILVKDIADVIEEHARKNRCSVVNQFVGHGVGIQFHEAPQIPHHYNNTAIPLAAGMTFTIEPMINGGNAAGDIDEEDGWTARTLDGSPSAQYEHTLLITEDSYEILTLL